MSKVQWKNSFPPMEGGEVGGKKTTTYSTAHLITGYNEY